MAATELETLIVAFEARTAQFDKSVQKLNRDFNRAMGLTERRAKAAVSTINATLSKIGRGVKTSIAAAVGIDSVERIAQRGRQAVASLAGIADAAEKVGASTDEIQAFRYAMEQAGGSAEDADSGLVQWARHLADATNKGNDLTKILEANNIAWRDRAPLEVLRDYADLIQNAASFADKMTLVQAGFGKSGAEWIQALGSGAAGLAAEAEKLRAAGGIISEEQVRRGAVMDDQLTHIASILNANINRGLSEALSTTIDWAAAVQSVMTGLGNAAFWDRLREALPADPLVNLEGVKAIRTGAWQGPPTASQAGPGPLQVTIRKRGQTVIPENLGGGASKTESAYERETQAISEKVEALDVERATLGLTTAAAAEYTARQELLSAAAEKGAAITNEQAAEIDRLAGLVGKATAELDAARVKLEGMNEAQKAFAAEMSGAFEGLIVDGKSLNEIFADILDNLARLLIQAAIAGTGPLAGLLGTAAPTGTGGAGGLFGLLSGALQGGGVARAGHAYLVGEKGPEIMVPKTSGYVIPNAERLAGGGAVVNMPVTINAPGADPAQLMRVAGELAALKADVPRQVRAGMASANSRRVRV